MHLAGSDISGGAITAAGSARCRVDAASTLHGLTSGIPIDVPGGQTLTIGAPGITSNGLITVNVGGDYAGTYLTIDGAGTVLGGTGGVRLNRSSGDSNASAGTANLQGTAGASLVMGSGQSLTGSGRVALPVTLNGTLSPGVGVGGVDLMRVDSGGSIVMTSSTQSRFDLASGASFDHVDNLGTVNAAGTLTVTAAPGFAPAPGSTFDTWSRSACRHRGASERGWTRVACG
jgi:hypothetical protein